MSPVSPQFLASLFSYCTVNNGIKLNFWKTLENMQFIKRYAKKIVTVSYFLCKMAGLL